MSAKIAVLAAIVLLMVTLKSAQCQFYPQQHYGQPEVGLGRDLFGDDNFDQETTPEEEQSRRINPVPFVINPGVRRGVQR